MGTIFNAIENSAGYKKFLKQYYQSAASPEASDTFVCLGRNEHSECLIRNFPIKYVVDDFTEETEFKGLKIINSRDIPQNCVVVNCSYSIYSWTAHKVLLQSQAKAVVSYALMSSLFDLPALSFSLETYNAVKSQLTEFKNIHDRLISEESRQLFLDVLSFRVSGDNSKDYGFKVKIEQQYFEDFLLCSDQEIFVDGGAFTGDTAQGFIDFVGGESHYKSIYLFEPDFMNLQNAKENLRSYANVHYIQKGLSDCQSEAFFNNLNESFSAVSDSGDSKIELTTIDDIVDERATFIKLDVEGYDLLALKGAKQQILENHPKLAVSVYHNPEHFWLVPEFVFSLRDDYDLELRHYTEGWSETIMYFIPRVS